MLQPGDLNSLSASVGGWPEPFVTPPTPTWLPGARDGAIQQRARARPLWHRNSPKKDADRARLQPTCKLPKASGPSVLASRGPRGETDPAAADHDAGAPPKSAPGAEGDSRCGLGDTRLGSGDKELRAGAEIEDAVASSPTPRGISWPQERWMPAMEPAGDPLNVLPRPCRLLILLNPRGGKGKALQLFWTHVQPMLVQADFSFSLVLTEHRNHARELVYSEELSRWDALAVMSGDGLMHEVINGLMDRLDWEIAIRTPLYSLPAGSGNALAASLNHYAGYEQVTNEALLINCTRLMCSRLLAPMSLLSLQLASGQSLFSMLSLAWGFIADVDLETEKYRCLGEMRFTLGTFLRLAALRTYQGRLSYLPAGQEVPRNSHRPVLGSQAQHGPEDTHLVPLGEPVPEHWSVVPEQEFVLVLALLHSHLGSEMYAAPMGRCASDALHLFYMRAGVSRRSLLRLFLAMEKGRHMELNCPYLEYVPARAFRLEPKNGKGVFTVDGELIVSEAVQGQVHPDYWRSSGHVGAPGSSDPQRSPEKPL